MQLNKNKEKGQREKVLKEEKAIKRKERWVRGMWTRKREKINRKRVFKNEKNYTNYKFTKIIYT